MRGWYGALWCISSYRGRHPSCLPNTYSLLPHHLIVSQFCSGWQGSQIKIQFPRLLCSERCLCDIILTNESEADLDRTFLVKLVFFWWEEMEPTQLFPFAISPPSCLELRWVLQGGVLSNTLEDEGYMEEEGSGPFPWTANGSNSGVPTLFATCATEPLTCLGYSSSFLFHGAK